MTETIFFAGGNYTGKRGFICDAMISISPTFKSSIASNPIETGANISDHAFSDNLMIDIVGVVSNTPIFTINENVIPAQGNRVKEAYEFLKKAERNHQLLTIVAEYDVYRNMVITSFSTTFDKMSSDVLEFRISLEQLNFAQTKVYSGYEVVGSLSDSASNTSSAGRKSAQDAKLSDIGLAPQTQRIVQFFTNEDVNQ